MKQRLHPNIAGTDKYTWKEIDINRHYQTGDLSGIKITSDSRITADYARASFALTVIERNIIRISLLSTENQRDKLDELETGIINNSPAECNFSVSEKPDSAVINAEGFTLELLRNNFGFSLSNSKGIEVLNCKDLKLKKTDKGYSTIAKFKLSEKDRFFGFGGRSQQLDRRGLTMDMFATKVARERGDYGGYPMPFFINPAGYGFILNNPWPHTYFDLGYASSDTWLYYTPDGPMDLYIMTGDNFRDILDLYYRLTGRPVLPPKWMFGLWFCWAGRTTADDYEKWMKRFRKEKWPIDVAVIDSWWRGGMVNADGEGGEGKNLGWDEINFGNGPDLINKLHNMGIKVGLHLNTRMYTDKVRSEGLKKGFLRKSDYGQTVPVLCDNESAKWNWNLHKPRVDEGADLWWTDDGERVEGFLNNGLPSRNLFGQLWNQFLFNNMRGCGKDRSMVLSRSGWMGAQRFTIPWPGDTKPGVDRIKQDLWYSLNLAVSGVPFNTVDLGGFFPYDPMHTDANVIRRMVHGFLLFPVPRLHNHPDKPPKLPWRYSEKVQKLFRYYLELRYRLFPYIYSAAVEAVKNSVPVTRPLAFDYSDDTVALECYTQLLLGPGMLMAPVVEEGHLDRMVYLPAGRWVNYWTGEIFNGNSNVLVESPLYEKHGLPVFVKTDSIIPYRPLKQYNQEEPEEFIMLDLYPETRSRYRLWEDEENYSEISYCFSGNILHIKLNNNSSITRTYMLRCLIGGKIQKAICKEKEIYLGDENVKVTAGISEELSIQLVIE